MGAAMHAESPRFSYLEYDGAKVEALARALFRTPSAGGILVAEIGGKISGMMAFVVSEHFFSGALVANDLVVYVKPEHRGSSIFTRLVAAFETWAARLGAVELSITPSTGVFIERTAGALKRLGYENYSIGMLKKCAA